jgi:hypothetical protein
MKKILLLLALIALGGLVYVIYGAPAATPEVQSETKSIQQIKVENYESKEIVTSKENDFCGEGIGICASGLLCLPRTEGDAIRICKVAIVNKEKKCSVADVKEVCASRDGESTTYLNACFAEAHGATMEAEGRCKGQ